MRGHRIRRTVSALVSIGTIAGFLLVVVPGMSSAASDRDEQACLEFERFSRSARQEAVAEVPAFEITDGLTLSYKENGFVFLFGRRRDTNWKQAKLDIFIPQGRELPPAGTELLVQVQRPTLTGAVTEDRYIRHANIVAFGVVASDRHSVDLFVCIDVLDPEPAVPGSYAGEMTVGGKDGFSAAAVPLEVNLQSSDLVIPAVAVLIPAALAVLFQWWISGSNQPASKTQYLKLWRFQKINSALVFGLGGGLIAAFGTVFFASVWNDPAWNGGLDQLWRAGRAAAVAAGAAYPAAAAASRLKVTGD